MVDDAVLAGLGKASDDENRQKERRRTSVGKEVS
jgi:hypothetical protein